MIKKFTTIVVMLFIMCTATVFAGDIPESLMLGEQKALFIGELISTNKEKSIIKPLTIMMGSIAQKEISVDGIEGYYGTDEAPTAGDFIVVVLLSDNEIDESWIFKATSSDYKKLKLVSENYNMVERYQEYINDGAYFEAQERLDKKKELSTENTDKNKESVACITEKDQNRINYSAITVGGVFVSIIMIIVHILKKRNFLQ